MLSGIGVPGLILILLLALILFGPSKLPQLGRAVGTTLSEFKRSTRGVMDDVAEPVQETVIELKKEQDKPHDKSV